MAKQNLKNKIQIKSDTTKIPKPYEVRGSEIGQLIMNKAVFRKPADSTTAKMKYNNQVVKGAILKRNSEREKEGKKPIPTASILKTSGTQLSVGLSNAGKTFKESPLKVIKKKK
jgi:hypothetical protein